MVNDAQTINIMVHIEIIILSLTLLAANIKEHRKIRTLFTNRVF